MKINTFFNLIDKTSVLLLPSICCCLTLCNFDNATVKGMFVNSLASSFCNYEKKNNILTMYLCGNVSKLENRRGSCVGLP